MRLRYRIGFGFHGRRSRVVAVVVLAVGSLFAARAPADAAPLTVVTVQFDDSNADVYQWISSLNNHGFPATFYVNSGNIAAAGKLTWAQLTALSAAGTRSRATPSITST